MRLGKIRGRTAEHFHFLFEEFVAFAELTKFSILGTRDAGFLARFNTFGSGAPLGDRSIKQRV